MTDLRNIAAPPAIFPYYAKSGGIWQRHPITGHGHLILTENVSGEAERVAAILNYYTRVQYVEGRKPEGEAR